MSLPMGFIPDELDYNTYMIEYFPGTYGDFICAIISYSIDDFFDPFDPRYTDEDKYWKITDDTVLLRNKYPLSCRGGGYEHIEKYTELMLAHKVFLDYHALLTNDFKVANNIMFNTHTKLPTTVEFSKEDFRTLTNAFFKTSIKCLTIDTSFDSILMSACNEHYTSTEEEFSNPNWERIFNKFMYRLKAMNWIKSNIHTDKTLDIKDIRELNVDVLSEYGDINEEKFDAYLEEYKEQKLYFLNVLTNKRSREIFADQTLKDMFINGYEKINDATNDRKK